MTHTRHLIAIVTAITVLAAAACSSKSATMAPTTPASHATVAETPAAARTATPTGPDAQALYTALLNVPWHGGELPSDVSSPKAGVSAPSDTAKSHHVVGEVEIDLTGPDASDAIAYGVFPTTKDAAGDWNNGKPTLGSDTKLTGTTTPPSMGYPATQINASISGENAFGKQVTNGGSVCVALVGLTLVEGVTTSVDNHDSGNVPLSCSLLKAAIAHLKAVESQAG